MNPPILVTSCTERKSLPVDPYFQVRHLGRGSVDLRVTEWVKRLSRPKKGNQLAARDLYAGEHWSVAKSCIPRARALYVVSAGYGLVSAETVMSSYGATFSRGKPDSIADSRPEVHEWWTRINQWEGPSGRRPQLSKLARKHVILLAASAPYIRALEDEIAPLDPETLLIVSAGSTSPSIAAHRLVVSDRLLSSLGGTSLSLNIRVAEYLLSHMPPSGLSRRWATRSLAALDARSADRVRHNRQRLSDEDVNSFIVSAIRKNSRITNSQALRLLRDSGLACEQHRFGNLFRALTGETP